MAKVYLLDYVNEKFGIVDERVQKAHEMQHNNSFAFYLQDNNLGQGIRYSLA